MSDKKTILHKRSKVIDALTHKPAIPKGSGLKIGEIAMHFKEGYERLYIKNDQGNIATFKADDGWENGYNIVTSISDLPIDKANVLAKVSDTPQMLSLSESIKDGSHMHIIVEAENDAVILFPIDDPMYKVVNDTDVFQISAGEIGDIDIEAMSGKMYLSAHIRSGSWFSGITKDGSPYYYGVNLQNNSYPNIMVESGEKVRISEFLTNAYRMFLGSYTTTMPSVVILNRFISLDVSHIDTSRVDNMREMFSECNNLTTLDVSNFNTSKVTDMDRMFNGCSRLTSLDLSNFDTSKVTDMDSMFYGCYGLTTLDVSNFDTSNVTSMNGMFSNCYGLTTLDVSNFDTSKVMDMSGMFWDCSGLTTLDVSNFDTSKVMDMSGMFWDCSGLTTLDLSNFDTSKVTDMESMFWDCSGLTTLDLSNFDTSNVTGMAYMFYNCSNLRYITLGENFFNTKTAIPFGSISNLGFNEDGTDNGWLEHLATVAPTITDGQSRTLQLHANLKNASWAATHLETLQTKGYTIA